jgi:hypothetical protein
MTHQGGCSAACYCGYSLLPAALDYVVRDRGGPIPPHSMIAPGYLSRVLEDLTLLSESRGALASSVLIFGVEEPCYSLFFFVERLSQFSYEREELLIILLGGD